MSVVHKLKSRSNNSCELCKSIIGLQVYEIPNQSTGNDYDCVYVCEVCNSQLSKKQPLDAAHWQCLQESMWSEFTPVKVVTWRMLNRFKQESWATDLLDMLYLDEPDLIWAKATGEHESVGEDAFHRDSFGALLQNGDTVVLTKSLDVKGSTINVKVGTVVRNIRLVYDNSEQIEGKIEGQTIVILTKYLRKKADKE
jgi:protein PhnA